MCYPPARKLSTKNEKSCDRYLDVLEDNMDRHCMQWRLDDAKLGLEGFNVLDRKQQEQALERLDKETTEYQLHAEKKCRRICKNPLPFCEPVKLWVHRKRCWQGLLRRMDGGRRNTSNLVKKSYLFKIHENGPHAGESGGIPHPKSYTRAQVRDGIK